jgi:hypothetical protein
LSWGTDQQRDPWPRPALLERPHVDETTSSLDSDAAALWPR